MSSDGIKENIIDIAENLSKPLILIAEDDDITRVIAVKTFENLGYRVITASDGQQAIDICYAERPQVILMDGSMPGIDGFGACQQIKKAIDESIRNIPIIIITALESDEAIDKAFLAGAEDYITKPVNWHILEHRLDVLIKKVQAEKSLRQSEERFHTIFNEAPLGLAVIDSLTGRIYDVNPAYMRIVGRTAEELKTISWMEITHPDDAQESLNNIAQMNAEKTAGFNMQKRYIQPDGTIRWAKVSIVPVQAAGGSIPRHLCMAEDITQSKNIAISLRKSEARYGNIFENSLTEIFIFDAVSYKFIKVNHGARKNIGYTLEELNQLTPLDIKPELTLKQFDELVEPLRTGRKEIIQFETVHQRKNGTLYSVEIHLQLTEFLLKPAFVAIILDITERKKAEESLQLSAKVFNETNEGITITDATGIIVNVNPAFCEITGYSREEVIGKNPRFLSSGKQVPGFYEKMWQSINEQGYWQGEVWNRKKEGALYAELLSVSPILAEDGGVLHYVGIFSDITHIKKQQETLEQMAHYDVLTQLPNRVLLADRFVLALAHSKRQDTLLAVCFLDLDNFKPINDTYGHATGDQLLIEVAERIKINIRDEDTVSRQGGDEFILLLGDIESLIQCEKVLKRIIESLAQPYVINEQSLSISASVGVTLYPADDADFDTLMRHADQAMYQAKLAGRNRFCLFNTEQNQQSIQKTIQLKEIQKALADNEFCLYYQPKVNMQTGKVFGAEALIRWNHPEKGLIPPLEFLPIIEETELEVQIGSWVISEALQQLSYWQEQGLKLEVSVNISSYHLQSLSFITALKAALALFPKIQAENFQLEILESSALGDLKLISRIIETCVHTLGVGIALDDFGTGYSSLTHMRNLQVQTIKIDQSFVRDMIDDPNDYVIIDGVIGLADSFNRKVIAEGVESTEHGLMLLIMGCNEAQGHGISPALPSLEFQNWLINYTPNQEWLACANKTRTAKEKKRTLFSLVIEQWKKNFRNKVLSSSGSSEQWPILVRTNCHCGIWIKRARQEQTFAENWLKKLEKAHDLMHDIADDMFKKYQLGDMDYARAELDELLLAVEHLNNIVGQCE